MESPKKYFDEPSEKDLEDFDIKTELRDARALARELEEEAAKRQAAYDRARELGGPMGAVAGARKRLDDAQDALERAKKYLHMVVEVEEEIEDEHVSEQEKRTLH